MIDWSKYEEYRERGLPQMWPDGRQCHCRECEEARRMGLGQEVPTVPCVRCLGETKDEPNVF
jgi:hypothetical protein